MLTLARALRLGGAPSVALVGAGGKTTLLFLLAQELNPSIVTATTHLGAWQAGFGDRHVLWPQEIAPEHLDLDTKSGVTVITGPLDLNEQRFKGLDERQIEKLIESAAATGLPLFVEADGSRQRPLKAPAEHEPPIPASVRMVVTVAGLSGLGRPLSDDTVHRSELYSRLSGLDVGRQVTAESLSAVLMHPEGGLKNIPAEARRSVVLTQVTRRHLADEGGMMARKLTAVYQSALLTETRPSAEPNRRSRPAPELQRVILVRERIAGIILAAGASSRMGRPKQLLDFYGKPFVCAVVETALAAGLSPVIVITGSDAARVEAVLTDYPVTVLRNESWSMGQSTSVRRAIAALPREIGATVILLADQPQVSPSVIQALAEQHSEGMFPIVAPMVENRRGNPLLFDRITFDDLLSLEGDMGGRAILEKHETRHLPWPDRSLLMDVDEPEDYRRLLASCGHREVRNNGPDSVSI